MKKHIILTLAMSLALCAVGFAAKSGMTDLMIGKSDFSQFIVEKTHDSIFIGEELEYLDNLFTELDQADIIVRAVYAGERVPMYQSTLSIVEVTRVIRGDADLVNKNIAVYEGNFYSVYNGKGYYRNFFTENLMIEGREYYLFLHEKNMVKQNEWNLKEYASVSLSGYCCLFPATRRENDILALNEDDVKAGRVLFGSIENYSYVVTSKEAMDQIQITYENIMERYNLE